MYKDLIGQWKSSREQESRPIYGVELPHIFPDYVDLENILIPKIGPVVFASVAQSGQVVNESIYPYIDYLGGISWDTNTPSLESLGRAGNTDITESLPDEPQDLVLSGIWYDFDYLLGYQLL
jgi:hypothetical protein